MGVDDLLTGTKQEVEKITLNCNDDGVIKNILNQKSGLSNLFQVGEFFLRSVHSESVGKALTFFTELKNNKIIANYEINFVFNNGITPLILAGAHYNGDIVILVTEPQIDFLALEKIMAINSDQVNIFRKTNKELAYQNKEIEKRDVELLFNKIDITELKRKENEIIYLSFHDQLTGLYNRRFFEEELVRLDNKRNLPITIVMGDVNGLKLVNDSFGHFKGDELLKAIASLLKKGFRADDIIARWGGDEFIIILPKTDKVEALKLITRINKISSNQRVGVVKLSISFGYESKMYVNENIIDIIKKAEEHLYKRKLFDGASIRSDLVEVIMRALYEKNNREMLHSQRVGMICEVISSQMNFTNDEVAKMKLAGLMHDVGKIGVDEKILNKNGKLTDDEWNEMKKHSEIGYRILSAANEFSDIANYVLEHQEKWDGTGYPKGLKGEEITKQARIIGVADAYDAMLSYRVYGKQYSKTEAINELKRCTGTQFDPEIVKVFIEKVADKL